MAANFNVNYDFNQHLEQTTGDDHALECLLVDEFSLQEEEVGQVHVSTSSEDAIQELQDAFSVERKKTLHHRKFITHQAKVKDSKQ